MSGLPDGARRTALALARALLPPGRRFPGGGERTVDRLAEVVCAFAPGALRRYATLLGLVEHAPRPTHGGRPLSRLAADEDERFLDAWADGGLARRSVLMLVAAPLKAAHFDDPEVFRALGCKFRFENADEPSRLGRQVARGADVDEGEIECDAVIVGTGAGGAVVARELCERGYAVVLLEEGEYHTRADFTGRATETVPRFYRGRGGTGSMATSAFRRGTASTSFTATAYC